MLTGQAKRAMEDAKGGPNLPPCGPKGEAIRILPEVYPEHNSVFRMKVHIVLPCHSNGNHA
jgi:hypothetical protein